jgi:hypothetical protein
MVVAPMRLEEDAVDLLEIHHASLIPDGFEQGAQAEVASATQEAFAGANDQRQGLGGESVVTQAGAVELGQKEGFDDLWRQARKHDRVGDAGTNLLVDGEGQRLQELGLAQQDQVVGRREVLQEQPEATQAVQGHEVSIIDDGDQELVGAMDLESLLDEEPFALMVVADELDLKGLAEDAQGVVVGVEGAVD